MESAKHMATLHGHTSVDSVTTLVTKVNPDASDGHDEMMDLNVCGFEKNAYFEWVTEYGDPIGDIFHKLGTKDFVEVIKKVILSSNIGSHTTIAGWPTGDIAGLFDALQRWPLDRRQDLSKEPGYSERPGSAPFRGLAWGHCHMQYNQELQKPIAVATKAIYPDHPNAVRFCGNFTGQSFGFWLDTDNKYLIERLDAAIAANMTKFGKGAT